MTSAILIANPETVARIKRLTHVLHMVNKTAAVDVAVTEALRRRNQPTSVETPNPRGSREGEFEAQVRKHARKYVRLREEVHCRKSGTRIYTMLARHGPVETAIRTVMSGPSDGLRFCAEHGRLDLAIESDVVAFADLFPEKVVKRARDNLKWARDIFQI
jgi:hypothetical protein